MLRSQPSDAAEGHTGCDSNDTQSNFRLSDDDFSQPLSVSNSHDGASTLEERRAPGASQRLTKENLCMMDASDTDQSAIVSRSPAASRVEGFAGSEWVIVPPLQRDPGSALLLRTLPSTRPSLHEGVAASLTDDEESSRQFNVGEDAHETPQCSDTSTSESGGCRRSTEPLSSLMSDNQETHCTALIGVGSQFG
ncbi:MAG: hypothetical protein Q9159_006370 [Coniocarpon cinnabarinum]